jgi:hypothetical protein
LTLPSALNYQLFRFETTRSGPVFVGTLGANVVVGNSSGQVVVEGSGLLGFVAPGAGQYYLILESPTGAPVSNYAFAVRTPVVVPTLAEPSITPPSPSIATPMSTMVEAESTEASPLATDADVVATASPTVLLRKPARPEQ